jgi:spore maturation protein CgeB
MPWSIPEQFIAKEEITCNGNEVAIFGGRASKAYDIRNWCRERACVTNYENSGVENKKMSDAEYFRWLGGFDAVVAAGSSLAKYDLVTPKYFEIAAAGALLFAQDCKDLEILGFDDTNCIRFTKESFEEKVRKYQSCPEAYLEVRKRGRDLIRDRHTIGRKLERIKELFRSS